jgi:hypothetical protein
VGLSQDATTAVPGPLMSMVVLEDIRAIKIKINIQENADSLKGKGCVAEQASRKVARSDAR